MNLKGSVRIRAPRARVWEFLTDPRQVSACAPGLESLEDREPGKTFRATAGIGLGSMRVRFVVDVEWTELARPSHAAMKAHGTAAGSTADASTRMTLTEIGPAETGLEWEASVVVSGTIASLASRMMGSASEKLTREFFDCVRKELEG